MIFLKINIVYYYGKRALIHCVFRGLNPLFIEITRICLDSKFSLVFKYIKRLAFCSLKNIQKEPFIKNLYVFLITPFTPNQQNFITNLYLKINSRSINKFVYSSLDCLLWVLSPRKWQYKLHRTFQNMSSCDIFISQ